MSGKQIVKYVLITAARNEENYIKKTIESVVSQTILPQRWIIISDRSSDSTDEIVMEFNAQYKFIELLSIKEQNEWSFSSKADAIRIGYERLINTEYEFIGILDADITFEINYFESVLTKFQQTPRLGIGGGMISEWDGNKYNPLTYNLNSVAGAVQLFRRECYEKIGGYVSSKMGGIDAIAEVMSKMNGWDVRSFPELKAYHHRQTGTTNQNIWHSRFRYGQRDYSIGNHPLFMFMKSIDRFREKPYVFGGILMWLGYTWSLLRNEPRPISHEVVHYLQREQFQRMMNKFFL